MTELSDDESVMLCSPTLVYCPVGSTIQALRTASIVVLLDIVKLVARVSDEAYLPLRDPLVAWRCAGRSVRGGPGGGAARGRRAEQGNPARAGALESGRPAQGFEGDCWRGSGIIMNSE